MRTACAVALISASALAAAYVAPLTDSPRSIPVKTSLRAEILPLYADLTRDYVGSKPLENHAKKNLSKKDRK